MPVSGAEGWTSQESIFRGIPGKIELRRFLEGKKPIPTPPPLSIILGSPRLRTNWTIGGVRITMKTAALIGAIPPEELKFELLAKISENGTTVLGESSKPFRFPKEGFFSENENLLFDIEFFAPPVIRGGNSLQLEISIRITSENKESENAVVIPFQEGMVYVNYTAEFVGGSPTPGVAKGSGR